MRYLKLCTVAAVLAIFGLSPGDARAVDCSAGHTCTAVSGNDSIVVDLSDQNGLEFWDNDGQEHFLQQWFWLRVGDTAERSLDTLPLSSAVANGDTISLVYCDPVCGGSAELVISVTYVLLDNGANGLEIVETVQIRNSSVAAINDIHFFEYTDLDINGSPNNEDAEINAGVNSITQVDDNGTTTVVVTAEPTPDRWQISAFSAIRTSLKDGNPTTLTNATSPLNGVDNTHAFEWEFDLGTGETFTITKLKCLGESDDCDPVQNEASLTKELTSGPDEDQADGIDLAVQIGQLVATDYDFTITYEPNGDTTPVVVLDTVPAEWVVTEIEGDGTGLPVTPNNPATLPDLENGSVDVSKNGKGAKSKSATNLAWEPDPAIAESDIRVDVTTRQSPGTRGRSGKTKPFAPTSCGRLALNDGAIAFEIDPQNGELVLRQDGEPGGETTGDNLQPVVIAGPTDPLILVALDGDFDLDGGGDLDGDNLTDLDEVSHEDPADDTNPCDPDTDGDGVDDDVDNCPLQGPANASLGQAQFGEPLGCWRQSQCSDGIDNDNDALIDFSGFDASCDDIIDDSEDTFDDF